MKKFLSLIVAAMMCMIMLSACSSDKDVDEGKSLKPSQNQSESASDGQTVSEPSTEAPSADTKYGNAEVYTNDNGNDAAKTESGVEVELSGDNLQKLYGEYQKVAGSGSDKEKELLDQIQLILEASQSIQQVQE